MSHPIHPGPFIIHPPDGLIQNDSDLMKMNHALARKYANAQVVTDDDLRIMGHMLWNALQVQKDFEAAYRNMESAILPIIIESSAAEVQSLPWETLFHPEHGFLGRHLSFTLTRRIPTASNKHTKIEKGPLRVLLFTSLPEDVAPRLGRLNIEEEQFQVQETLLPWIAKGHVQLEMPDDGRFSTLRELLQSFQPHVLFLSGHGLFHHAPHAGEAYGEFFFESETGESEAIREEEIADALRGTTVQAVVLSACESGKAAPDALSKGLIRRIHALGIPHVIGMRESISDTAGIELARSFCSRLAHQDTLDVALQCARESMSRTVEPGQWCLPLLISSGAQSPLIDWDFQPLQLDVAQRFNNSLENVKLPERFVGRRAELRHVKSKLVRGEIHRVLITGPGGHGKTSLAGKLALDMKQRGWQVFAWSADSHKSWHDFEEEMQQALDISRVNRYNQFLPRAGNERERVNFLLHLLLEQFNQRVVLFLDKLDIVQDPDSQSLNHPRIPVWIEAAYELPDLVLFLTSRWQIAGWNDEQIRLAHANYGDFLQMAQRLQLPSFILEKSDTLHHVYNVLGGNGRGLELFAEQLNAQGAVEENMSVAILAKTKADLQENMAIRETFEHLPADAQSFFRRLPAYQNPVPVAGVLQLGEDLPEANALLERLMAVSLLETTRDPHTGVMLYQCHPLALDWLGMQQLMAHDPAWLDAAADYLLFLLDRDQKNLPLAIMTQAALHRAGRHLEADLRTLNHVVGPLTMAGSYQRLLTEFLPNICDSEEKPIRSRALAYTAILLKNIGDYHRALLKCNEAINIMRQIGDKKGEGAALNTIGQIYLAQGQTSQALSHFEQALYIQQQIGDKTGEATSLHNIAALYQAQGEYAKASIYLKKIEDRHGQGATFSNIAQGYFVQGDYKTALAYLSRALTSHEHSGDRMGAATTLNNISQIYKAQNAYETALLYLNRAQAIQQQIDDVAGKTATLHNIAEIYERQGEYEKALLHLEQALAVQQRIGDKAKVGITLNDISGIYRRLGDYEKALPYLNQALELQRKIHDKVGEGTTLNNIATIYQAHGEYEKALSIYGQALVIQRKVGDTAAAITTLNNIATIHQALGDEDQALESFKKVLVICRHIGKRSGESITLNNIALIYKTMHDYKTALEYFHESLLITEQISDLIGEGATLDNIGTVHYEMGDLKTALKYWERALATRQQVQDKGGEGQSLSNLAQIHLSLGNEQQALTYLEQAVEIQQQINDKPGLCASSFTLGHIHLKNGRILKTIDAWTTVYQIAKELHLSQPLQALHELGPQVGLSRGLDDWELLAQKRNRDRGARP